MESMNAQNGNKGAAKITEQKIAELWADIQTTPEGHGGKWDRSRDIKLQRETNRAIKAELAAWKAIDKR